MTLEILTFMPIPSPTTTLAMKAVHLQKCRIMDLPCQEVTL